MNREEAKLILQVYRPGGQDEGDPQFAEALALAKHDPELAAWFARQQQFDTLVSGGMRQVRVPSRLKREILAGGQKGKNVQPAILTWWQNVISFRSPAAWAMAGAVVLLFSLAVYWQERGNSVRFADYRQQMVRASENDTNHVDIPGNNLKQALAWLGQHHGESDLSLPAALGGDKGLMGCRVLEWHGQKVSMLCYGLNGSHVDLFVARADFFEDAPTLDKPQFAQSGGVATASWTHNGQAYLMVAHSAGMDLQKVLQPEATASSKARRDMCL